MWWPGRSVGWSAGRVAGGLVDVDDGLVDVGDAAWKLRCGSFEGARAPCQGSAPIEVTTGPKLSYNRHGETSGANPVRLMPSRETKRRSSKRKSTKRLTADNYHDDPLYPRIVRAVEALLARGKVVAPVDVLIEMGLLDERRLEDW